MPINPKKTEKFLVPAITDDQVSLLRNDDVKVRQLALLQLLDASLPALPIEYMEKLIDRRQVEATQEAVYRLNGGIEWEKAWAEENPTEFFKLRARRLPETKKEQQQAVQIVIKSNVPKNDLDNVNVVNGEVVDTTVREVDEDDIDF